MAEKAPALPAAPARGTFTPFVPATETRAEFTVKAILLGAFFGLILGASTVYPGLIAGGSLAGILYAILFGREIIRDPTEVAGLIPAIHDGTGGLIAGGCCSLRSAWCWRGQGRRSATK